MGTGPDASTPARVLGGHRRDHGGREYAVGRKGLEIGLYAGAGARVAAADRHHDGGCGCHVRHGTSAPSGVRRGTADRCTTPIPSVSTSVLVHPAGMVGLVDDPAPVHRENLSVEGGGAGRAPPHLDGRGVTPGEQLAPPPPAHPDDPLRRSVPAPPDPHPCRDPPAGRASGGYPPFRHSAARW